MLMVHEVRAKQGLGSVIASLLLLGGCSQAALDSGMTAPPISASLTASGYVLISQPDSMTAQALSFGRTLQCPAGKLPLGGGVQNANYGVVIQESAPNAAGSAWSYTVSRDSGGSTVGFVGWAVCADSSLNGYTLIARADTLAPGALTFGRTLSCPAPKRVLGGGVQNGTYGVVVQETRPQPSGTAWAYTVSRNTGGSVVTFTGRAICADSIPTGYTLVSRPDTMGHLVFTFGRSLTCPTGKQVFSGGVQNANYGVVVQENHPSTAGNAWAYTLSRKIADSVVTFTGWAVCATAT